MYSCNGNSSTCYLCPPSIDSHTMSSTIAKPCTSSVYEVYTFLLLPIGLCKSLKHKWFLQVHFWQEKILLFFQIIFQLFSRFLLSGGHWIWYCKQKQRLVCSSWPLSLGIAFLSRMGFPGGSDAKESACNAGDLGSVSRLERSPGRGNGNPLQYSCLENPMTEEPGRLQSKELQRVRYDWANNTFYSRLSSQHLAPLW